MNIINEAGYKQNIQRKRPYDFDTREEAWEVADMLSKIKNTCPPDMLGKPHDVLGIILQGDTVGLNALASLKGICFIKGKVTIWGDAMLAVCRNSPNCIDIEETFDEETMTATCTVIVKGITKPIVNTFSKQDAVTARLWGQIGPWSSYPKRMLQMRARSWSLRAGFPSELNGMYMREEAEDIPERDHMKMVNSTSSEATKRMGSVDLILHNFSHVESETEESAERSVAVEGAERELEEKLPLSPETFHLWTKIEDILDKKKISNETQQKWLDKFNVSKLEYMPDHGMNMFIEHYEKRI